MYFAKDWCVCVRAAVDWNGTANSTLPASPPSAVPVITISQGWACAILASLF